MSANNVICDKVQQALRAFLKAQTFDAIPSDHVYKGIEHLPDAEAGTHRLLPCIEAVAQEASAQDEHFLNWLVQVRVIVRTNADDTDEDEHHAMAAQVFGTLTTDTIAADLTASLDDFTAFLVNFRDQRWELVERSWQSVIEFEIHCCGSTIPDSGISEPSLPPELLGVPAHAVNHENGGIDEISVEGLSGLLADAQTPLAHKTSHENGGADEINVTGLSGLLADAQTPLAHKSRHQDGGNDEINVTGLSGLLADPQTPLSHNHTSTTGDGGVLTNDEHDGYLELAGIATPSAPAVGKTRLYGFTQQGHTFLRLMDQDGSEFTMARDSLLMVRNTSGGSLTKGTPVDIYSATGMTPAVRKADANEPLRHVEGVMYETVANNGFGLMLLAGHLSDIDTSAFSEGDVLWLGAVTPGTLVATQPDTYPQLVGVVTNSHASQGSILVRISALPNHRSLVALDADVASTATTNFQDITALSFSVRSGIVYRWQAMIIYTTSAATIGIRVACTVPANTLLSYQSQVPTSITGSTDNFWQNAAYIGDNGTSSPDSIHTSVGNLLTMFGVIKPSADGTVQLRFAPETATASGVIIKAGSTLEFW